MKLFTLLLRLPALGVVILVSGCGGETEPRAAVSEPPAGPATACYRSADLQADTAVPGGVGTPLEVCEKFWRETGFEGTDRPTKLVVCEGRGAPSVFPGGAGTCEGLGLSPAP